MRQETTGAHCLETRSDNGGSRKRRELMEKRRVLRLLTIPEIKRKLLLRKAYRSLSRWQRFMHDMGLAEFLLKDGEIHPEYRINWVSVVVWVFTLCLAAFYIFRMLL